MKIDYELVEKIEATHYCETTYTLYKVSAMTLLVYIDDDWRLCLAGSAALGHIKPIPPKPPVRVEYEKVAFDKISDLASSYENGEVFYAKLSNGNEYNELSIYGAISFFRHSDEIFRRIEKPVDWRDEVKQVILSTGVRKSDFDHFSENGMINFERVAIGEEKFLDMCRVALRANGEL